MRLAIRMVLAVSALVVGCGASVSEGPREPGTSDPAVAGGEPGCGTGTGGVAPRLGGGQTSVSGESDPGGQGTGGSGDAAESPPPGPPPPPPPPPEAETAFREGLTHMQQADFTAALAAFRRSYELAPRPATLFNIAACLERLGDDAGAIASYERFLIEGGAEISAGQRQAAEDKIRALREPPAP